MIDDIKRIIEFLNLLEKSGIKLINGQYEMCSATYCQYYIVCIKLKHFF